MEITIDGSNMRRKQIRGDSDEEGDDEDELLPVNASGVKAFKQRDLVAEAFAGDNVVEVNPSQLEIGMGGPAS